MADSHTVDWVKRLRRELGRWQRDGLISEDQASRILARYAAEYAPAAESLPQRCPVVFMGVLGAVLMALVVIIFVAAGWSELSRWSKLLLVLVPTAAAYGAGYSLRFAQDRPAQSDMLLLAGTLVFGAGIFLVGQAFSVPSDAHYGLLLWAIGILPLGYALPMNAMLTLAVAILVMWTLLMSVVGLEQYRHNDVYLPIRTVLAAGITVRGLGHLHAKFPASTTLARPYLVAGTFVILSVFYAYTFLLTAAEQRLVLPVVPPPLWRLESAATLLAAAMLMLDLVLKPGRAWRAAEITALGVLLLVSWAVPPGSLTFGRIASRLGWVEIAPSGSAMLRIWPAALVGNLLFFGTCLGAAALGVKRRDPSLVNLGLTFVALGIVSRYVDVFWTLLTRPLFFIIGGLLLVAGGRLVERARRYLLRQMEDVADGA